MTITVRYNLDHDAYVCECGFNDRTIPKEAGFTWTKIVEKKWATRDVAKAMQLAQYADEPTKHRLRGAQQAREQAVSMSRASTIDVEFDKPDGLDYLPYQKVGIAYQLGRQGTLLADEMGLGKTIQLIGLINNDLSIKKVLIPCPASLKLNWKRELEKWLTRPMTIGIVTPDGVPDADILICNYDILHRFDFDEMEWDLVAADEAHYTKNGKSRRAKALHAITNTRRRVAMTGTPIVNRPAELFPILHWVDPITWPKFWPYAMRYCLPWDAPVLMADLSEKRISDIQVGDMIMGWAREVGGQRRLLPAKVIDTLQKVAPLQVVTLANGDTLTCTPDHRWATGRSQSGDEQAEYSYARVGRMGGRGSGSASRIMKVFDGTRPIHDEAEAYMLGYIHGFWRGDGHCSKNERIKTEPFRNKTTQWIDDHKVGCACNDKEPIDRIERYLLALLVAHRRWTRSDNMHAIEMSNAQGYTFISETSGPQDQDEWWAGFLGGIYDAEGSGQIISQSIDHNPQTFAMIENGLARLGFTYTVSVESVRMVGGRSNLLNFWNVANPTLRRKLVSYALNGGGKFSSGGLESSKCAPFVAGITPLSGLHTTYTLTTETGNYIAYGYGSKNCDAKQGKYGWELGGASNLPELQQKLRETVMIRRMKADVLKELPPKRRSVVVIPSNGSTALLKREQEAYDRHQAAIAEARAQKDLAQASENKEAYAQAVAKLRAVTGVMLQDISRLRHETAVAKAPHVAEHVLNILEDNDGYKVIVFCHHKDVVDLLMDKLSAYKPVKVTGDVSMTARQAAVDAFQNDPSVQVFIGNIQAAGVGLTLTASSHVVFAELDWTPGNVSQCEDRAHRISQTNSVLVEHLVFDNSLDAKMAQTIIKKQAIIEQALDRQADPEEIALPDEEVSLTQAQTREEVSLTQAQTRAVHEAMRILAGSDADHAAQANGVGFDRYSSTIGHSLADAYQLSPKQAALGYKLSKRFRGQLPQRIREVLSL